MYPYTKAFNFSTVIIVTEIFTYVADDIAIFPEIFKPEYEKRVKSILSHVG